MPKKSSPSINNIDFITLIISIDLCKRLNIIAFFKRKKNEIKSIILFAFVGHQY